MGYKKVPQIRFMWFDSKWLTCCVDDLFSINKGKRILLSDIKKYKTKNYIYPTYSSQVLENGFWGYFNKTNFSNSITWTMYGNPGICVFRYGNFYATDNAGVISKKILNPSLYFSFVINNNCKRHIEETTIGIHLPERRMKEVELIYTPNLNEQQKISQLIKTIDNKINKSQKNLKYIKEFRNDLLNKMIVENHTHTPSIRFDGFDEEWNIYKISDLTHYYSIRNKNNHKIASYSITNELGFVKQKSLFKRGGRTAVADKSRSLIVYPNSFAYNPANLKIKSIGYYTNTEECLVSAMYEIFKTNGKCDDMWLFYWLKSDILQRDVKRFMQGSVRITVNYSTLKNFNIAVPNIQEQQKISKLIQLLDKHIELKQKQLDKYKNIKEGLINKMYCS